MGTILLHLTGFWSPYRKAVEVSTLALNTLMTDLCYSAWKTNSYRR